MSGRKSMLTGSVSVIALITMTGAAWAQQTPEASPPAAPPPPQTAQSSTAGIEEITVTGIRGSLDRALDAKRNADGVMDSVSAEDIGQLPAKNVADALQHLPGIVTIQSAAAGSGSFGENDRIELRGTAPSLTQTLIDGHTVGTGDWFILDQLNAASRSVSYSMFPSEFVDSINVYKSSEADQPEGGTAGTVDIRTRSPLGFADPITAQLSAGAAYSDLANKVGPTLNGLINWKNDDETLGVLLQGFREDRYLRRDGQEILGYATVPNAAPFPTALRGVTYPQIINYALFEQERLRQGGDFAVEFRPEKTLDIKLDGFYSYLNAPNYNQGDLVAINNLINNGVVPTSYTVKNGVLTQATFPGVLPNGVSSGQPGINDIYRPDAGSSTYYLNLETTYKPFDPLTLHAQVGYTRGKGSTNQWALGTTSNNANSVGYGLNGTSPASVSFPGATGINNPANYSAFGGNGNQDWIGDEDFAQVDTEGYGSLDAEYALDYGPLQSMKAGVRVTQHVREETEAEDWAGCYSAAIAACNVQIGPLSNGLFPSNFGSGAGFSAPFMVSVDPGLMQATLINAINAAGGPGTEAGRFYFPAAFAITENTDAGYLMAKLGGDRWQGNVGVRVASTSESITSYDTTPANPSVPAVTSSLFGTFYENHHQQSYVDILPSAAFKFDLDPQWVMRASAAETVTRPDYYSLAGGLSLNDQLLSGTGGNPNLKPTRSSNFDFGLEWYYAPESALTATLFDMVMSSTFDLNNVQASELNLARTLNVANPLGLANPIYTVYNLSIPVNNSGQAKGLELAWQQPLAWGFGAAVNFTYTQSSQNTPTPVIGGRQLLGAAKEVGNATVYYQDELFDAHLTYTAHSQIYEGIDRNDKYFLDDGGQLDAAVNFNINENLVASLNVLNIADEISSYVTQQDLPRATYDNGRTFYFSLTAKFAGGKAPQATPEVAPTPVPPPPPAPIVKAPEAQRQFQVFFDFDKSDITDAAAHVIQAAADAVKAGNVVRLAVTGHTDTVGSAKYNQALSERRAAAVKAGLVADGVNGGEITTLGVGKTGLLVPTADGVREPQNRRAEIVLQ